MNLCPSVQIPQKQRLLKFLRFFWSSLNETDKNIITWRVPTAKGVEKKVLISYAEDIWLCFEKYPKGPKVQKAKH